MRLGAVLAIALLVFEAGCGNERRSALQPPEPDPTLSEPLMVALQQARSYHHLADTYLEVGDTAEAIAAVEKILAVPFPPGAPEGRDTLLDARARLAKLYLGAGRPDDARRIVDEGLAAAPADSFFTANLLAVSGDLFEARAKALDATDAAAAKEARLAAIRAYSSSIEVNKRVQARLAKENVQP